MSQHPPCPSCGRGVFPMEDKVGGEACLRSDLKGVSDAAARAMADLPPSDGFARGLIENIKDIADRHAVPAGA